MFQPPQFVELDFLAIIYFGNIKYFKDKRKWRKETLSEYFATTPEPTFLPLQLLQVLSKAL